MNLIFWSAIFLTSCGPSLPSTQAQANSAASRSTASSLSAAQKAKLGHQIWKNESGGTINGLTAWNVGEEFPSLGIGHFIWYPKNYQGPFNESFPSFIHFAQARGVRNIPRVALQADCPWNSRANFQQHFQSTSMKELRTWLSRTVPLQTDFIIAKSRASFQKILQIAPTSARASISRHYQLLSQSSNGTYALIDYVNFKGEGTSPKEQYKGQGWGLLQVLSEMRSPAHAGTAPQEFAKAAKRVLDRRISNSPRARGEARWRTGWHRRCDTYAAPF